jgi:tetratricopeptide (TPR) repeat protein
VLASPVLLTGFAFMIGVAITIVLPTDREYAEVTSRQQVDAYSIAYLSVLTRANPKDANLRFVFVRQLAQLGRWDEALETLAGVPDRPEYAGEARDLRLAIALARARAFDDGDPLREKAFADVHAQLSDMLTIAPDDRLEDLAKLALELEDPALAAKYFLRRADAEPSRRAEMLALAARWMRAAGDGVASGECYRRAADAAPDESTRVEYLLAGADSIEGATGACDAAKLVEGPAAKSTDKKLVARAATLLTSCGRVADARMMGRRQLELAPDDETTLRLQVRRELAAGDSHAALGLVKKLLALHPNDPKLHELAARVAEWSGQPSAALPEWLWLLSMGRGPSPEVPLP